MEEKFEQIAETIQNRRTVKADRMNGKKIPEDLIQKLSHLADFAPTHGRTEPWRFLILKDKDLKRFSEDHADMYQKFHPKFNENTYEKLKSFPDTVSHLMILVMLRTENTKIPWEEEYAACCAAAQNILLGASALNISAIWNTGAMANSEQMKKYLGFSTEDKVVAFLYLGYSDEEIRPAIRKIPFTEKMIPFKPG